MNRWNHYAYLKISALAGNDEIYLELQAENKLLEAKYTELMGKLEESERELVDRYIASCEDLEFRFAQLAYCVGLLQNN